MQAMTLNIHPIVQSFYSTMYDTYESDYLVSKALIVDINNILNSGSATTPFEKTLSIAKDVYVEVCPARFKLFKDNALSMLSNMVLDLPGTLTYDHKVEYAYLNDEVTVVKQVPRTVTFMTDESMAANTQRLYNSFKNNGTT